jgi:methyl-accepting chemotaxis protein
VAVTSLQFQDIATQLIGHTRKRMEQGQRLLHGLATVGGTLTDASTQPAEALPAAVPEETARFAALIDEVRAVTHRNPAQQAQMAHGDVELF